MPSLPWLGQPRSRSGEQTAAVTERSLSVLRHLAAPPDRVYEAVSDLGRPEVGYSATRQA